MRGGVRLLQSLQPPSGSANEVRRPKGGEKTDIIYMYVMLSCLKKYNFHTETENPCSLKTGCSGMLYKYIVEIRLLAQHTPLCSIH